MVLRPLTFLAAREHSLPQLSQASRLFVEDFADFMLEFDGVERLGNKVGARLEHTVMYNSGYR